MEKNKLMQSIELEIDEYVNSNLKQYMRRMDMYIDEMLVYGEINQEQADLLYLCVHDTYKSLLKK